MLARLGLRPEAEEDLARLMDGTHTTEHFLELARDLDVLEPKTPEDVYKSHLEKRPSSSSNVDSARGNLASTFVNGFVNVGFGTDKLMLSEGNKWLYKNKEHGMMSAAASLGLLRMWDVEGSLSEIDKYQWSKEERIHHRNTFAAVQALPELRKLHGEHAPSTSDSRVGFRALSIRSAGCGHDTSLFPRLVLVCINADFDVQIRIFQHLSRSTGKSFSREQILQISVKKRDNFIS